MLILGMNSKRQRRPNVRLGEIGEISTFISCNRSHKLIENWEENRWEWRPDSPSETNSQQVCGFSSQKPNSESDISSRSQTKQEFLASEGKKTSKYNLGSGRTVKNRRFITKHRRQRAGGDEWNSRSNANVSENGNSIHKRFEEITIDNKNSRHFSPDEKFEDFSSHETSETSKEGHAKKWNSDEISMENEMHSRHDVHKEEGNNGDRNFAVECVRKWLADLGCDKYVGLFRMHEVDEEALPLLTFEDLKEMGIHAVGPRRKLFTAIQRLKEGSSV